MNKLLTLPVLSRLCWQALTKYLYSIAPSTSNASVSPGLFSFVVYLSPVLVSQIFANNASWATFGSSSTLPVSISITCRLLTSLLNSTLYLAAKSFNASNLGNSKLVSLSFSFLASILALLTFAISNLLSKAKLLLLIFSASHLSSTVFNTLLAKLVSNLEIPIAFLLTILAISP